MAIGRYFICKRVDKGYGTINSKDYERDTQEKVKRSLRWPLEPKAVLRVARVAAEGAFVDTPLLVRGLLLILVALSLLDGLGEMLHGVLDSVTSLGADAVDEGNASLVLLGSNREEVSERIGVTSVGQVVLVGENAQEDT